MNGEQLTAFIHHHPLLGEQLRALAVTPPARTRKPLALMHEASRNLFLAPIITRILGNYGLPWEWPQGRYDDEQPRDYKTWAEGQGGDAAAIHARQRSGERIMNFLNLMSKATLKNDWQALRDAVRAATPAAPHPDRHTTTPPATSPGTAQ